MILCDSDRMAAFLCSRPDDALDGAARLLHPETASAYVLVDPDRDEELALSQVHHRLEGPQDAQILLG